MLKKITFNYEIWSWLIISLTTIFFTFFYRQELFLPFNEQAVSLAYSQSQYVLGDQAVAKIDDNTLYQYAGLAYFKGEDPTTVNFEHPPLAKYLFGFSLWAFKNIFLINLLFYACSLWLFSSLLKKLNISAGFSLVALAYLAIASGLAGHLRTALFDLQILTWTLAFFNLLLLKQETWQKHGLLGLVLGLLMATKYFFPIIFLFIGLWVIWAWQQKTWGKMIFGLIITGLVYLLAYLAFFLHQHSWLDFVRFEWFRFRWWTDNRTIPKFIILETLFLGQYRAWWDPAKPWLASGDWNFSWPILFLGYLSALLRQKIALPVAMIVLYSLGLLTIYLFGSAVYGRYLLQLIPFWLMIVGLAWSTNRPSNQTKKTK